MTISDLRRAYLDLLMEQVDSCDFPSPTMLDRIELAVGDRDSAEEYVRSLLHRAGQSRFPSPTMLDRLSGLIDQLDLTG